MLCLKRFSLLAGQTKLRPNQEILDMAVLTGIEVLLNLPQLCCLDHLPRMEKKTDLKNSSFMENLQLAEALTAEPRCKETG